MASKLRVDSIVDSTDNPSLAPDFPNGLSAGGASFDYEEYSAALDGDFTSGTLRVARIGKLVTVSLDQPSLTTSSPFDGNSLATAALTIPTSMRPTAQAGIYGSVANIAAAVSFAIVIGSDGSISIFAQNEGSGSGEGAFCNADITTRVNSYISGSNMCISYVIA